MHITLLMKIRQDDHRVDRVAIAQAHRNFMLNEKVIVLSKSEHAIIVITV